MSDGQRLNVQIGMSPKDSDPCKENRQIASYFGSLRALVAIVYLMASGCGPWRVPPAEVFGDQQTSSRPRILLVAVAPQFETPDLSQVSSCVGPEDESGQKALSETLISQASHNLIHLLKDDLREHHLDVQIGDPKTLPVQILEDSDDSLNEDAIADLKLLKDADLILRFRLTDYGSVPDHIEQYILYGTIAWTSGVAAVAYASPATRPYVATYLATELVQEGLGTYVGFNVADYFLKMARIEAELIRVSDGAIVWSNSHTGTAWRWSVEGTDSCGETVRDRQLSLALERAVHALTSTLISS